jgi:hypothetical protein
MARPQATFHEASGAPLNGEAIVRLELARNIEAPEKMMNSAPNGQHWPQDPDVWVGVGFSLRRLALMVDFLGPHTYPFSDDAARQMLTAAFS